MAFEHEIEHASAQQRPKLFTEYSTGALVALACQLGMGIVALSILPFLPMLLALLGTTLPTDILLLVVGYVIVGVIGFYQSYLGWKLHKGDLLPSRCVIADIASVIFAILTISLGLIISPLFVYLGLQGIIALLGMDIVAIAMLSLDQIRQEFAPEPDPSVYREGTTW
ncbi:MAG: hypothetical protein DRP09_03925 [Candidatus Thorarchaeota archaeon]|nr:MAG: hypothetical protein DRP09_03925 [Candidatus Thorarchaeota archaeon]